MLASHSQKELFMPTFPPGCGLPFFKNRTIGLLKPRVISKRVVHQLWNNLKLFALNNLPLNCCLFWSFGSFRINFSSSTTFENHDPVSTYQLGVGLCFHLAHIHKYLNKGPRRIKLHTHFKKLLVLLIKRYVV